MIIAIAILWVGSIVGATLLSRQKMRVSDELINTLHQNHSLNVEEVTKWCKEESVTVDYSSMLQ